MSKKKAIALSMLLLAGVFAASLRTLGDLDVWFQLMGGRHGTSCLSTTVSLGRA